MTFSIYPRHNKDNVRSVTRRPAQNGQSAYLALHDELDDLFNSFFGDFDSPFQFGGALTQSTGAAPRIDVEETEADLKITADVPGYDEKDINVTLDEGLLTLSGETTTETEDNKKKYHVKERSYGSFTRSIALPDGLDLDKVSAKFKKGVLNVVIPKAPEAKKAARQIDIQAE